MSILVPINGVNYIIPEPNEVGWGSNLDAFFVAISAGVLQKTGGNFVLSAEADFGSSFGLKSLYYKSRGANISSTGVLRLNNNSDAISFRNAANNADLPIIVNASDQLLYNGNPVLTGTSPSSFVSSILGTANQVIASSPTGTVTLSLPQSIATSSSPTFAGLTLSSPLTVANGGTGNASLTAFNILAAGTTSTGALQTISVGASGQVLTSNGAGSLPSFQNVSGTGTVNSGTQFQLGYYATSTNAISGTSNLVTDAGGHLTIRPTTNQLVLGGTGGANTVTINGVSPITSNYIISIPGLTESCSFVVTDSGVPQTIAATKTFTAIQLFTVGDTQAISATNNSSSSAALLLNNTNACGANMVFQTATATKVQMGSEGRFLSNTSQNGYIAAATGLAVNIYANGSTTPSLTARGSDGAVAIQGTTTNDSAAAGFVGQIIESVVGATNFPATTVYGDLTSISLTAGDWLVSATILYGNNSATATIFDYGISTTSGNSTTGLVLGSNWFAQTLPTSTLDESGCIASYHMQLASTTTVYFKYAAAFSAGTPQAYGRITAVRIR